MELYIDKTNLYAFIEEGKSPRDYDSYSDCCRLLKRQLHIIYNFCKEKIKDDEVLRTYFLSAEGKGWSEYEDVYLSELFPVRPIKTNIANSFNKNQYSSIFLIDDEKTNLLINRGTFIVGTPGKEVESLNKLFCGKDYDFHKIYDIQSKDSFPNWEQLSIDRLNLPLTDIIVMDRYLGAQISDQLTAYNILKLIEVLVEHIKAEVNVLFFCNKQNICMDDWKLFRNNVREMVKKQTGVNCNVTIVFYPQKAPHDRMIFTNYMLYKSGDSFEYFDSKGNTISQGKSLDVNSLAKRDNYDFAMSIIKDMQNLYENIYGKNPDMVIGDKKSNYIKFTK